MGIQQILLTTVGGGGTVTLQGYPGSGDATILISQADLTTSPDFASITIYIELNSNGNALYSYQGSTDPAPVELVTYNWLTSGSASDFYAFMDTPSSGAFDGGTVNTNLQLNTTRVWQITALRAGIGTTIESVVSTLRIRNSSFTDLVTKAVDLTVEATVS